VNIWKNIGRFGLGLPFLEGLGLWLSGSASDASAVRQNRTEEPIRRTEDVSKAHHLSPVLRYLATYAPLREVVYLRRTVTLNYLVTLREPGGIQCKFTEGNSPDGRGLSGFGDLRSP